MSDIIDHGLDAQFRQLNETDRRRVIRQLERAADLCRYKITSNGNFEDASQRILVPNQPNSEQSCGRRQSFGKVIQLMPGVQAVNA